MIGLAGFLPARSPSREPAENPQALPAFDCPIRQRLSLYENEAD